MEGHTKYNLHKGPFPTIQHHLKAHMITHLTQHVALTNHPRASSTKNPPTNSQKLPIHDHQESQQVKIHRQTRYILHKYTPQTITFAQKPTQATINP